MASFHTHGSTSGDDSNSNTNHSDDNVRLRLKALTDGTCADCSSTRPSWASLLKTPTTALAHTNVSTIAAFVCYHCAAHHRSLGTHICRVKSCTLDDWNDKEIWAADVGGNQRVNAIFEALPLNGDSKPTQHSTSTDRAAYIREKYVQQRYLDVANYKFCRARRTQSVVLEEDESIASDIFSAFMTPSPASSRSNRQSLRNIATPKTFKSSLFFTPPSTPATPVEKDEDEEDMFADSATTTSDLFGYGRPALVKSRSSSFDGEVIEEGEEDGDSEEDDNASELPYPKMAQSVSNFSTFTLSSTTFRPKGSVDSRSVPSSPLQGVQAPMLHSPIVDMETLKRQKKEALDSEDYMRAAQIKRQMAALLKPSPSSPEIESLESLKKLAVRQEDYVRAAQLKARIDELRCQGRSNRQLQVESSMNSAMVSSRTNCEQGDMLGAFFGKDYRVDDDKMQKAIENGQVQAEEADDIEDESLMLQRKNSVLSKHFEKQDDASERFSRSIMEASQHSRLDNMGFVVNDADVKKQEQTDVKPSPPKIAESPSSRRTRRTPVRDPTRDGGGRKKSRSRSRTRRDKLRRRSTGNEKNDEKPKLQSRDIRNKDDSKQRRNRSTSREKNGRNRSASREKKSERNSEQRDRSKSKERSSGGNQRQNRDRSKSRDRRSHNKDKEDRDRSKSRDRKSNNRDKDSRERSKSRDRKSSQRKPRDRSKSNERRSDTDKQLRSRSKSRERKSSDKSGRTGRQPKVVESPSTRNRSKSRSRRDPRRKSTPIRPAPGSREVQQSTSFSLPANGESFLSPLAASKTKQFSTSMPTCVLPMFSPGSKGARDSSFRRKMLEVPDTCKEKPIHHANNLQEDTSVDESFTTFASDNVQSAHQRNSAGRVSLSRRNIVADTYNHSYEVSPKGSHSMHLSRRGLSETFERGLESQTGSFFAPKPPIASPSMSTISGVTKRSSATSPGFQTPSSKPYSKRQLIVGSPAGVEDFPSIATTPEAPKRKESMTEKYKQEVERTVARLERLREMKRHRGAALTKERRSATT